MMNSNNKQTVRSNILKFKKKLFNARSIYKHVLGYLSIILGSKLNSIVNNPEFKPKVFTNTTSFEKIFLSIGLIDFPPLPSNPEYSDVPDPDS